MIDELDFAFEEHPDRGRHRHRHSPQKARKKKKRRRRGRTVLALVLAFLLLGSLGGVAWYGVDRIQGFFGTPDYTTAGVGEVQVEVKENESLTEIGNALYRAGVVKSAEAFIKATEKDPRSANIQPGVYKVRKQMRASDALAMLLDLKNKIVNGLTIKEGAISVDIYTELSKKTGIKVEEFRAAAQDPVKLGVPEHWFRRTDGKPVTRSIEGFLFPATYELKPGLTAEQILKEMVNEFLKVATETKFQELVERDRGGISPYEALIVASLAQAEAGNAEDLGKVARVAYNRLYKTQPSMKLEFDVTINYHIKITGGTGKTSDKMTEAEMKDPKNPYSTHAHAGLPPTPIGNPGKAALEGAMNPPKGDWLFFVAIDKQGRSAFAVTNAEHERNIQTACRNGVLTCP